LNSAIVGLGIADIDMSVGEGSSRRCGDCPVCDGIWVADVNGSVEVSDSDESIGPFICCGGLITLLF